MSSKVTIEEIDAFFRQNFHGDPAHYPKITLMEADRAIVRMVASQANLRPGGYISGPTQMGLADQAAYAAVFTRLGIVPMAVTSNLNINFLRPCIGSALTAEARIQKLGRTLAVMEVEIKATDNDKVASHAIVTYSLPADL